MSDAQESYERAHAQHREAHGPHGARPEPCEAKLADLGLAVLEAVAAGLGLTDDPEAAGHPSGSNPAASTPAAPSLPDFSLANPLLEQYADGAVRQLLLEAVLGRRVVTVLGEITPKLEVCGGSTLLRGEVYADALNALCIAARALGLLGEEAPRG